MSLVQAVSTQLLPSLTYLITYHIHFTEVRGDVPVDPHSLTGDGCICA